MSGEGAPALVQRIVFSLLAVSATSKCLDLDHSPQEILPRLLSPSLSRLHAIMSLSFLLCWSVASICVNAVPVLSALYFTICTCHQN